MSEPFKRPGELLPAIVQDINTGKVLMLGYMNEEAYQKTFDLGKVTFFSRSKGRLWTKGETSGNYLMLKELKWDCDEDTILVKAIPEGPTCHTGSDTCFNEENTNSTEFLHRLSLIIKDRKSNPSESSYTTSLFANGINKIAQKVGEEAVELVIEAKDDNDELFKNEAADLIFHLLVLLEEKDIPLADVVEVLKKRHNPSE